MRTRSRIGVRALAAAGIAFAALPLTAAASNAAPPAAGGCFSAAETRDFGRGEVTVCPNGGGTYRATGWIEDLLPGDGAFTGPDGACVEWDYFSATQYETHSISVCPHFDHKTKLQVDEVLKPQYPLTRATLGRSWY
ncbi:hypothetical protein [Actinomadura fibrosa]|uniref:Secreted protein n=1 Tax=Actinomadura fibrosa TaxID=111802 RepID=A0ABW2Y0K9_9ACTN|nr:hypothetical protein [Actinomadura fibrosa]